MLVAYLRYLRDYALFVRLSARGHRALSVRWRDRWPVLGEWSPTQAFDRHYVYHPAWAVRVLNATRPKLHVDVSSSLPFVTVLSAFVRTAHFDLRPPALKLSGLHIGVTDLLRLPFADHSLASVSCMHVVEHVGLGRYGDAINPDGDILALQELRRVLAPGGNLLIVTPIGRRRVTFNAHRVYAPADITGALADLELAQFCLIPENARDGGLVPSPSEPLIAEQQYGCGCFWFRSSQ